MPLYLAPPTDHREMVGIAVPVIRGNSQRIGGKVNRDLGSSGFGSWNDVS